VPVATAMRFSSHRIAGVFNVSTIPEYRRRGIGEAMTWRAAVDGLAEGCIASALQASEMGLPIYQRMGYRQVLTYQVWLPASQEDHDGNG
jgi:predicted GNAT family acetyltransferase